MTRVSFPLLVALVVLSQIPDAHAVPNCGPGFRVEPSYDSNGNPQPGGTCVPIEEPPLPNPAVEPRDAGTAAERVAPPTGPADAAPVTRTPWVRVPVTETPAPTAPATEAPPAEKKKSGCGGCSVPGDGAGGLPLIGLAIALLALRARRGSRAVPDRRG